MYSINLYEACRVIHVDTRESVVGEAT